MGLGSIHIQLNRTGGITAILIMLNYSKSINNCLSKSEVIKIVASYISFYNNLFTKLIKIPVIFTT